MNKKLILIHSDFYIHYLGSLEQTVLSICVGFYGMTERTKSTPRWTLANPKTDIEKLMSLPETDMIKFTLRRSISNRKLIRGNEIKKKKKDYQLVVEFDLEKVLEELMNWIQSSIASIL